MHKSQLTSSNSPDMNLDESNPTSTNYIKKRLSSSYSLDFKNAFEDVITNLESVISPLNKKQKALRATELQDTEASVINCLPHNKEKHESKNLSVTDTLSEYSCLFLKATVHYSTEYQHNHDGFNDIKESEFYQNNENYCSKDKQVSSSLKDKKNMNYNYSGTYGYQTKLSEIIELDEENDSSYICSTDYSTTPRPTLEALPRNYNNIQDYTKKIERPSVECEKNESSKNMYDIGENNIFKQNSSSSLNNKVNTDNVDIYDLKKKESKGRLSGSIHSNSNFIIQNKLQTDNKANFLQELKRRALRFFNNNYFNSYRYFKYKNNTKNKDFLRPTDLIDKSLCLLPSKPSLIET